MTVLPKVHVRVCWKPLTLGLTYSGPPSEVAHRKGRQGMFISCLLREIASDLELKMA